MAKRIATFIVSLLLIAVVGFYVVRYYIENFYDDPGAVSARELRITNEEVSELINEYEKLDHGEDVVVCVNPAYGGYENGASNDTLMEKDITLDVALALIELDTEEDGVNIRLTRYDDTAPTYEQRLDIVAALDPDIFVNLRVSEAADENTFGTESFYASDYYDYRLNAAKLADILERNTVSSIEGLALGVSRKEDASDSLIANVNAVAAEVSLGYVSSELEADAFTSQAYIDNLAAGLYNGIIEAAGIFEAE